MVLKQKSKARKFQSGLYFFIAENAILFPSKTGAISGHIQLLDFLFLAHDPHNIAPLKLRGRSRVQNPLVVALYAHDQSVSFFEDEGNYQFL